jgi:hypothetical protein
MPFLAAVAVKKERGRRPHDPLCLARQLLAIEHRVTNAIVKKNHESNKNMVMNCLF